MCGLLLRFRVFLTRWSSINCDSRSTGHVVEEFMFLAFLCSTFVALSFITIGLQANRRPINVLLGYLFELFLFGLFVG